MSKEEFMNIQTCVLKVNIHCEGCKLKIKKILQKIEGVFTTKIDAEQGKVTVSGSVDPSVLIEKLAKSGKHAEILGAPMGNNNPNQSQLANQLKGMQIDNGKGGGGGKKNNNDKGLKNGGGNNPQHIQKMKGFQELKLPPQLKDLKGSVPVDKNQNQKGVKLDVPEEEEDYDDFSDDDDVFTDAGDNEFDDLPSPSNEMKPNMMMPNNQQMMMNAQKNVNLGRGLAKNWGKGVSGGDKGEPNGGGGGKGDSGGAGNQNQGGGKNVGQNVGGGHPQDGKNGGGPNAEKKANRGGDGPMAGRLPAGFLPMGDGGPPHMSMPICGLMGMGDPMGNIPAGLCSIGGAGSSNMTMPIGGPICMGGPLENIPATGARSIPRSYFQEVGSDPIQMQQQQYLATVMNQQRGMGNEQFQPMMYARPPLAVNYMPPHLHLHQYPNPHTYPYPYPPHGNDQYSHGFNEDNTSSCDIM